MIVSPEWLKLREIVQRICDERLVIHRPVSLTKPTEHADDCPGCALRKALDDVGGAAKKASTS